MRLRTLFVSSLLLAGLGCNATIPAPVSMKSTARSYNGSGSVGDFLAIALDPAALTLTTRTFPTTIPVQFTTP